MTPATLPQHAVAAEAIARGDQLFALVSGDEPPAADAQLWLVPDGHDADAVAPRWRGEAVAIAEREPGVRCRASVLAAHPLDAGAVDRIAGMHVWCERHLAQRLAGGERLHAVVVRAWAAPHGAPPGGGALPPDEELLPALTDSAFALLRARLEAALRA